MGQRMTMTEYERDAEVLNSWINEPITKRAEKIQIWRRPWATSEGAQPTYAWHWWCPCCVGGDWQNTWDLACLGALVHLGGQVHTVQPPDPYRRGRIW